jgi:sugar phosphate isomerase/epimerase
MSYSIGFSTLGTPELSLSVAGELLRQHRLDFLEWRVLASDTSDGLAGLNIPVIGTSLSLLNSAAADVEEFYRCAELARQLGTPYLRVFGGIGVDKIPLTAAELQPAANRVEELREGLSQRGLTSELLLETHDIFAAPATCLALNKLLKRPLLILWDSYHTWHVAHETPAESWRQLAPLVRHIHYKDGNAMRLTLPSAGNYPAGALLALLWEEDYCGGVSLEWEKRWHAELSPLTEALPKFLAIFRP